MKLVSCNSCAVILDADKIEFPRGEDDYSDKSIYTWSYTYNTMSSYIECPVCGHKILEEEI